MMHVEKYIEYLEKNNYSTKAFIPLLLKLNPYLSHDELIDEAKRCSRLMHLLNPKIRKKVLIKALKKYQESKEEVGEFTAMFLSALIGSIIGNTLGFLIKEKFKQYAKKTGLL
jgi:hypothetical protein